MSRLIGMRQLMGMKFREFESSPEWQSFFGNLASNASVIIYGNSGMGKTRFSLELAKELSRHEKVLYNSLEMDIKATTKVAFMEAGMVDYDGRVYLASENLIDLDERLSKRKAPKIVIVDSFDYLRVSFNQYKKFSVKYPETMFIFLAHAKGKKVKTDASADLEYDVDVKIRIEGFVAYPRSRFGGNKNMVIWEDGARSYHGDKVVDTIIQQN